MAVLVTTEIQGQTDQGYNRMFAVLSRHLFQSPGFVVHAAHPMEGGWRIIEVWESQATADEFFAKHVAPSLPSDSRPARTIQELHSLLTL